MSKPLRTATKSWGLQLQPYIWNVRSLRRRMRSLAPQRSLNKLMYDTMRFFSYTMKSLSSTRAWRPIFNEWFRTTKRTL